MWITGPGMAELRDVADPVPGPGEALLAPLYTGLCGTDLELFTGGMPYFASGHAVYPILPGHEAVATVVQYADDPTWVGARVVVDPVVGCGSCLACLGGPATRCPDRAEIGVRRGATGAAAELVVAPGRNLHRVPDGLDARDAVLTEPGVTALHALMRTRAFTVPDVLVIGAGTLGLIATALLVDADVDVSVAVGSSGRDKLVRSMGARPVNTDDQRRYAVAIETAGTESAVQRALSAVRAGGQIALAGVQAQPEQWFRPNELVLLDLTVHGIMNGPELYDDLLSRLAKLEPLSEAVVGRVYRLEDFEPAFAALATPTRDRPKVLLGVGSRLEPVR